MKGYIFTICIAMVTTIAFAYNGLEYKGVPSHTSCTGQCYVDYVALNGTPAEMEQRKKELASTDEFSDIRGLWEVVQLVMVQKVKVWQSSLNLLVSHKTILLVDLMHIRIEKQSVTCLLLCGLKQEC